MRPFTFVPFALLCALPAPRLAAAQTGAQPNLVLTILGGTVFGHDLWTIGKQPLMVLGAPTEYDTLHLTRVVTSGIVLGVAATYFPSPHLGFHGEISYLGLAFDSTCEPVYLNPDTSGGTEVRRNGQVCDDISGQIPVGSMISIFGGVTVRAASRGAFSPYLRGGIGFVNQSGSAIDVAGVFLDTDGLYKDRQVIADPEPRHTAGMATLAGGFTSPLGPGYQFRLELRDHVINLLALTGPGSAGGASPTASRYHHHFALTLGLDVVLEKKRGRRY